MYLKERVVENRLIGHPAQAIYKLVLSGQVAKTARPGQFVHIQVAETYDPLLRRPLSIAGINPGKEEVTIYYGRAAGNDLLTSFQENDHVCIHGHLGNGFTFPKMEKFSLIAGGIAFSRSIPCCRR
jgi:dihydroorotate dehydrogenase electron transfer subunit